MTTETQVLVLGGGPGGYAAAFKAADLGFNVTLVESRVNPGGVCLFEGCIPSKALLHAAELIREARHASAWGLTFAEPEIDLDKLRAWKDSKVVKQLTGGLGQLAKARKVNFVQGLGTITDSHHVQVKKTDGSEESIRFEHLIIATGSTPIKLPFLPESERVMDSTGALELKDVPARLLVLGGGYIGLEMATVYSALGSEVTVVEMLDGLLMGADADLVKPLHKRLQGQLHEILLKTKVTGAELKGETLDVSFEGADGQSFTKTYDRILVAVGRRPNSRGIGLENIGLEPDKQGFITTDQQCRTKHAHIFAIGDVAGQPMLAHKASHEGIVAAEVIAGHKAAFAPYAIPAVVFTDPEVAWAGITEREAEAEGRKVTVTRFPWAASGRALTLDRTEGLTKLIADAESGRVLGVGIVGKGAGELIAEGTLAIEMGAVAADLALTIHAHPTLSETSMEAAEMFDGQSTHVYKPQRKK
ncbi:MAG: dihydrolipoyl dehydrogenase [Candidatus Sericytochromatia bacterium]|nr:dihydrolipoyl dehydrogenase [Candidatus Sericytochromatia bacterium]